MYVDPLNDLWQFNIDTKMWTWWRGSTVTYGNTIGKTGYFANINTPGSEVGPAMAVDPGTRMAVMLGNDLWQLNTVTMMWAWVSGSGCSMLAYGTRGIAAPENQPGGRLGTSMVFIPQTGSFLIFAGDADCSGGMRTIV